MNASPRKLEIKTSEGVLWMWRRSDAPPAGRPVVLTITGAFAPELAMNRVQDVVGAAAEAAYIDLPGNRCPHLASPTIEAVARALDQAIPAAFPDRVVILLGVSVGALVAASVTTPQVRRIVAVEPPLSTAKLWPMIPRLRERLAEGADAPTRAFVESAFGVTANAVTDLDHRPPLMRASIPVDVVAGDMPLQPPRDLDTLPSLLDDEDRAFLAARPGFTVTVAPGAGHNVPYQSAATLKAVLMNAIAQVEAELPVTPFHRALLARTPVAARKVRWLGAVSAADARELRVRNPHVALDPEGGADALIVDNVTAHRPEALAAQIGPGGMMVGAIPAGPPATTSGRLAALEAAGLEVLQLHVAVLNADHFDDRKTDLAPGWRRGEPGWSAEHLLIVTARPRSPTARPPMDLDFVVFAPRLMDIRTRLPSHALRTEPELIVRYHAPPIPGEALGTDTPKIRVLQRPALLEPEGWRAAMRRSIDEGWIVLLEYDDHPELVARVKQRVVTEHDWLRFGYVHAVQTSTPTLAAEFQRYNPETRVFPNSVFRLEPFPEAAPRRVFYGAVSRGGFAQDVARALAPATAAFPEVEFLVVGDREVFDALPTRNKRFHDFVPFDQYLRLMGTCSISLSPIEGAQHQETKSDAKFLDASARGLLTIASPTIYEGVIRHGETGLIARTADDWGRVLAEALGDEPARRRMARAAWEYVRDQRMFADQARLRHDWYRDLWRRRAELNAAVEARLPRAPSGA